MEKVKIAICGACLVIVAILGYCYISEKQNEKYEYIVNSAISNIVDTVIEKYPDVREEEILNILRNTKNNKNILSDISYGYLFNLSFCVILFYGIGVFLHIFVQRFVESMILVWLIYVLYCYNKIELIVIKKKLLLLFAVICIVNPFFALLHYFVKEEDYYMTELVETLSSYSLF